MQIKKFLSTLCLTTIKWAVVPSFLAFGSALAQQVDTAGLRADARFLSSDALAGRSPGSPGAIQAARYIVDQLRQIGAEPLGAGGSYFQNVPLGRVDFAKSNQLVVIHNGQARTSPETDFHFLGGDSTSYAGFAGRVWRVGNVGETIAALQSRADVRGRVIVTSVGGAPVATLQPLLERSGASGAIVIVPDSTRYLALRNARGQARFFVGDAISGAMGSHFPIVVGSPQLASLSIDSADSVKLQIRSNVTRFETPNIVARIPGRSKTLADQAVAYVAHYDHLGYGPAIGGDSVYNGFIDNSAGVAALLAIAKEVHAHPTARANVFIFATAEEPGSLGSAYYVQHPSIPLAKIVMVLNLDHPSPLARPLDWLAEGPESGSAGIAVEVASRNGLHLEIGPPQPNSDHWSFIDAGVPAYLIVPGEHWQNVTEAKRDSLQARWWRPHRPDDEWSDSFPIEGLASYAAFALLIGSAVANSPNGF